MIVALILIKSCTSGDTYPTAIADHGPPEVGVGCGRGCAQDGRRGGTHVAALQRRYRGTPTGDHSQVSVTLIKVDRYLAVYYSIDKSTVLIYQENIRGGRSRSEGLQGPARLLGGPPGQVLALLVEVSQFNIKFNLECLQKVTNYPKLFRHMAIKCSKQPDLPVLDTSVPMDQVNKD